MSIDLGPAAIRVVLPTPPVVQATVPAAPTITTLIARGPAGPPGSFYSHRQDSPAATWTVNHGLGVIRAPVVILDDNPTVDVEADYEFPDLNTTLVIFPEPATGWVYF